jgi:hypothetical protein
MLGRGPRPGREPREPIRKQTRPAGAGRQPIGTEPLALASGLTIQFSGERIWFCLVPEVEHMTRLLPQAVPYLSPASRARLLLVASILGLTPRALC